MPQRKEILCFIVTSGNRLARSAIRRTWGKVLKPLFIIQNDSTSNFLQNESDVFSDMVVIESDSELSFGEKFSFAVKFSANFSSQYFMFIGDDVLINVENFYEMLNDYDDPKIILPKRFLKFNEIDKLVIVEGD